MVVVERQSSEQRERERKLSYIEAYCLQKYHLNDILVAELW